MIQDLERTIGPKQCPGLNIGSMSFPTIDDCLDQSFPGMRLPVAALGYANDELRPARDLGLGPGYARELPDTGLLERFRYDDHDPFGRHINYEIWGRRDNGRMINIGNYHINLDDE